MRATFFRDISIKRKVNLVILISSMTTLLLAGAAMVAFQWFQARSLITRDLATQARIIAANSTAALKFQDSEAATEMLSALQAKPHMISACLYTPDRKLLAHFGRAEDRKDLAEQSAADGFRYEGADLILLEAVTLNHKRIGTLFLRFDFRAMQREIMRPYLTILGFILPASFLTALLLSSLMQRVITQPVLELASVARVVAEQKDYTTRAQVSGRDELGLLTRAFNDMLARIEADDLALRAANTSLASEVVERKRAQTELEDLHRKMLDVSRKAGMTEVATGVLHNVGNVLNSVNVSTSLVMERLRQSKVSNLLKVSALLEQNAVNLGAFMTDDPKGRQLPGYIASLSQLLVEEKSFVLHELDELRKHIDHIKEIVAMQQGYAKVSGVTESVALPDVMEDALKLNDAALVRHGVTVRREFEDVPHVVLERHKVLQILVNLIRNAKHALDDSGRRDKLMTLKIARNGDGCLKIQVIDNGIGIPPENLTRIFAHGFTTKKDGHGFGLHSGALAAKDLGGSLLGHSEGLGRGATFTLELPLESEKKS